MYRMRHISETSPRSARRSGRPLYGVRLPHITRRSRLSGYAPATQNYDYPLHKALVVDSDKTVKVSIEGTGGNFTTAGGLKPHATFPMQFFSNNWIYEGLVRYGAGGAVEPALATEWASTVNSDGSETVRFRMAHRGPDRLAAELPRHCLSLSLPPSNSM